MNPARPLRDIFADPVGDSGSSGAGAAGPADVLRAAGHPDLPDSLVAEAVGSYADTAPIEVAEHLSTYVMAHSPVPLPDQAAVESDQWLDVVSTAPTVTTEAHDPLLGLDDPHVQPDLAVDDSGPVGSGSGEGDGDLDSHDDFGDNPPEHGNAFPHLGDAIDFGQGSGHAPLPDTTPDLPAPVDTGGEYVQPDHVSGPDILREADDVHHLDDTPDSDPGDSLDTWDDA